MVSAVCYLSVLLQNQLCVHFLCPHKKRTKESGWGRRWPLRLSLLPPATKTSSSPSSHPPPDPHPAPVDGRGIVGLRLMPNCVFLCDCLIQRIRLHQVCRPVPEGVHRGGRLEAGVTGKMVMALPIGFAVSASPMPASLVTFLSGNKKVTPPNNCEDIIHQNLIICKHKTAAPAGFSTCRGLIFECFTDRSASVRLSSAAPVP